MSNDFVVLTTRLASGMSILAAVLIGALSIFALVRGHQRAVPAIAVGRRLRTLKLGAGVGIAVAIILGAMPALAFPLDSDRFTRLYGVLGHAIQAVMAALVVLIIAVGVGAAFRRPGNGPTRRT